VRVDRDTRQPTVIRENTSITDAKYTQPESIAT